MWAAERNRTARQALLDTPSASEERETVKKALLNITKKRVKIAREYTVSPLGACL